jgi:formylglycine-generating enzyme required for sulfatase activity
VSRIFLSHSSKNNAEALALRDWLASQGWNDVFLDIDPERGLVASDRWQKALNAAIGRCRAVIFLLSPDWRKSEHCISELDLAMHAGAERIGVIVKDIPFDKIPTGLGGESQLIDLTRGGTPLTFTVNPPPERKAVTVTFPAEDLRALRAGLARLGLVGFDTESFSWPPPDEPDRAPFRGLEALDVKDAGVFYGRDTDLIRAREHLIELRGKGGRKLFVIQGASGSGKSSFMRAGLLPRLEREDRDFITLPLMRPGTAALSGKLGLGAALELAFKQLGQQRPLGDLLSALERDADALPPLLNQIQVLAMQRLVGEALPQVDRPPTLVLAIDQAEELFTPDAGQEAAKMRQHLSAALTRGPDTIGLLTIRSDRVSLLQNDDQLATLLAPFNLPPMPATVYREAILRPAARTSPPITIDAKLSEVLIKDTAAEGADPLPLLAFTLERLYRRYGRTLHKMEPAHYDALGGITGSINEAITEAFAEPGREPPIPADRKERERLLEAAFIPALVDINQSNGEPVSRIATEREIPGDCRNLVTRLINARLLVSDEGPAGADGKKPTTYRVAHEALLRRWDWLKGVLDLQAGQLSTAQLIERQAEAWDRAKRAKAWLDLRGDRLHEAVAVAGRDGFKKRLEGVPVAYITACSRSEKAASWKRRSGYAVVAVLLAGVGGAGATYSRWFSSAEAVAYRIINMRTDLSKAGTVFRDCSACAEMVVIPAGSFIMGSPESDKTSGKEERPQHKVTIAQQFAVSKFEITFDQWDACFLAGGCTEKNEDRGFGRGNRPAINVSWNAAQQYVKWVSGVTGQTYGLLTEAEWEYAARGGKTTRYSWGDEAGEGNANCDGCKSQWDNKQTAPVGSFKPNDFGLYDMHGNVWEWVQDCYDEKAYATAPNDGSAVTDKPGCVRVLRGGSWRVSAGNLRAADRSRSPPDDTFSTVNGDAIYGFRVARVLPPART